MRDLQLKDIPGHSENIQWREFGAEGILLNPTSGDYFEVSEVGMMIWKHVDGERTIAQIIEELASHFEAEVAALTQDTKEFLAELESKHLITLSSA